MNDFGDIIARRRLFTSKHHVHCIPEYENNCLINLSNKPPGPKYIVNNLTRNGKSSGPTYSFGSKIVQNNTINMQKFPTPGPGTYMPEDNYILKWKRAPAFSIGQKTRNQTVKETPGPNCYFLADTIGKEDKGFSFGIKPIGRKPSQLPGPGSYDTSDLESYKSKHPSTKMPPISGVEIRQTDRKQKLPGPNTYLPTLEAIKKNSPKYSFGMKHSMKS
uniref:Outer dense fiber protein 3 n=1 Tax=Clastoptera arizonana TaxID=38151 RepID=A0A1B6DZC4_9HEMI